MSIELITLLMFGSLVVLMAMGLPNAFATGGIAVAFLLYLWGPPAFMMVMLRVWATMSDFILIAVPMFILMASILERSGIGDELYEAIYRWLGSLRGGLAMATVIACAILAAMVGIVGAGVVMMGLVALPAMRKRGYKKGLTLGCVCAGGSLGLLIPPSILYILYGMTAGVSIGHLFAGGIGPGILLAVLFIIYIGILSYFRPDVAPALPEEERRMPLKQKLALLKGLVLPALLVFLVLGSIFLGAAVPSEAAGVGALGAVLCAVVRRRFNWKMLKESLVETTKITSMVIWIVFGASALIGVYTLAGGARFVEETVLALPLGRWGILILTQVFYIFMGMFIEYIGLLLISVPIFVPIIVALDFCPIWFGILFSVNMQIASLSPPFGYSLFYLKGVAPPDISLWDIYLSVWPFMGIQLITLILVMIFPQIAMWLPGILF